MMTEKRRTTRHEVSATAWLTLRDTQLPIPAVVRDLSRDGASLRAIEPVATPQAALLWVELSPTGPCLECKVSICWRRASEDGRQHVGVRFLDLVEDEREQLADFLDAPRTAAAHSAA